MVRLMSKLVWCLLLLAAIPFALADDTNLMPIPDEWDLTIHVPYVRLNSTYQHTLGQDSIQIGYPGADRQCWGTTYPVKPGDRIVGIMWIKIGILPEGYTLEDYSGARFGFDLRFNSSAENYYCLDTLECATFPDTSEGIVENAVHASYTEESEWIKKTIDFIVPPTYYAWDWYTNTPVSPPQQINQISMWMHMWSTLYGDSWQVDGWFADVELYINPIVVYVPEASVPFVTVVPTVIGGESVDVVVTGVDGAVVVLCLVICIGIFVGVFEGFRGSLSR